MGLSEFLLVILALFVMANFFLGWTGAVWIALMLWAIFGDW